MESSGYTSEEAYKMLIKKLSDRDAKLADVVQNVVDGGVDEIVEEEHVDKRKKNKEYIKTRAMTYEEALLAALHILSTYFVDFPTIVRTLDAEFSNYIDGGVRIELNTESKLTGGETDVLQLRGVAIESIDEQQKNIAYIYKLFRLAR